MAGSRWAWVEIDLDAIRHNVKTLKARIAPGTLFMAVVKADAYGHGDVEVTRAALEAGADRLGVATVAEAAKLRAAGVNAPIQLLSEPPEDAVRDVLDLDVIPMVTTREFAGALGRAAASRGVTALYHLKVDTGMNRLGVRPEEAPSFAAMLSEFPGLRLEGTFTHFATAEVPGDWDFTRQMRRFTEALEGMRTERVDPGIVHAANSAATILSPESHYAMVRCGISIYGLHPSDATRSAVDLKPAMSVKARATLVKQIGMGEGVSYGLTWHAGASATIATLPLGYGDGLHRVLSNRIEVLGGGKRLPQVGRICMDQMMVDAGRSGLGRGDEVVIVGRQGAEEITLDAMADLAGTINYELACAFAMRLDRVYS